VLGKVDQASIANRRTTRCRAVPAGHPTYATPAFLRHFPLASSWRLTLREAASDAVQSAPKKEELLELPLFKAEASRDLVAAMDAVTPERAVNHKTTFLGGISDPHKAELLHSFQGVMERRAGGVREAVLEAVGAPPRPDAVVTQPENTAPSVACC
jgi:hypothetical protein